MKRMSESRSSFRKKEADMEGWLLKWTNYIKGYQRRWFVLANGFLSYYRNPADMTHTCRGNISIANALIHTEDSCNFLISNGGTQTFHLRASNEVERQNWVTALELAKAKLIVDSEEDEALAGRDLNSDKQDLQAMLKTLMSKLDDLKTCHDLNVKRATALQRALTELEQLENPAKAASRTKSINERVTLFRITSSAMIKACTEYVTLAQTHGKRWQKLLQHEHESRLRLEEMIEQLAKQHSHLEQRAMVEAASIKSINSPKSACSEGDEEEFFDAEESAAEFFVSFPGKALRVSTSINNNVNNASLVEPLSTQRPEDEDDEDNKPIEDDESTGSDNSDFEQQRRTDLHVVTSRRSSANNHFDKDRHPLRMPSVEAEFSDAMSSVSQDLASLSVGSFGTKRIRRRSIPERPNQSLNLWSFMKNCIGKELTKIPMPVNFNEPLSMLQRVTEDFEYADLLHRAAKVTDDACEQLVYVAAFCVSHYANSGIRTGKPFNPLLGETYECDRSQDLGWKSIAEQVSHHPPMLAMHVEGKGWKVWSEFSISSKFRGKYLQVNPIDISHLEFEATGHHLTFKKVTTTVHNIIVGRLWIDNHGDMNIVNHTTGDQCHLKFIPYSYFSRDTARKVTGVVVNSRGEAEWVLNGTWDNKLEASKVVNRHGASSKGKPILETSTPKIIWKKNPILPDSEKMHNLTLLAIQLNEPEEGVAPTDSRLRPDQRLMEEGKWDEANKVKQLLEEKQRMVRRRREEEAARAASTGEAVTPYEPLWFERKTDPITSNPVYIFNQNYWKRKEAQDWSGCPDIFDIEGFSPALPSSPTTGATGLRSGSASNDQSVSEDFD